MRKLLIRLLWLVLPALCMAGCVPRVVFDVPVQDAAQETVQEVPQEAVTSKIGSAEETDSGGREEKAGAELIRTPEGEKVTLKIVDWSDSTKDRRTAFHEEFMKRHPDITIEYTTVTSDQFKETIISGLKAENAPDLFPLPQGIKLSTAVSAGWFQPLNPYASEGFFDSFEEGSFNEGITDSGSLTYLLPESANIINTLMFVNKTVLREAGYTEAELPKTWSGFTKMCGEISRRGKGRYFGIIASGAQTNRLELELRSFASLAGARCGDIGQILLTDGENRMNSEGMQMAMEFYRELLDAGAFHPDSTLLKAPEARALFADNQAAFLIQGAWCIATWREQQPDLDFDVMPLPVPDTGMKGKLPYANAPGWIGISANCRHPDAAMMYLEELFSAGYQSGLVEDGGFVSAVKGVNEAFMKDEVMKHYYEIHREQAAMVPDPLIGNPAASLVYEKVSDITPGLGDIVQGLLASAVDYRKELKELAQKTQAEWTRAIAEAGRTDAAVDAGAFEFDNWDTMRDYTASDYKEKKGE